MKKLVLNMRLKHQHTEMCSATRWIIPAHSTIPLSIDFQSQATGGYQNILEFEIVGTDKLFTLPCTATCAVPSMNTDTRNIFMRRAKGRPDPEKVHKKYVLSRSAYEFGPLRVNKPRDHYRKLKEDYIQAEELLKAVVRLILIKKLLSAKKQKDQGAMQIQ